MRKERIEELTNWLRDGNENEAADILDKCDIEYIFENIYFPLSGGEREYISYDVYIKAPRKILKDVKARLLGSPVEQIESAIRDFAEGNHIVHSISWVPIAIVSSNDNANLISESLITLDPEHIRRTWEIALSRKLDDPEGAITASRTFIESVCKHILDEKKISYTKEFDLPKLFYLTVESLNLSPTQHPERLIKQVLGNCQAVAGGIAALRNELGDAHGKSINDLKPLPAYAELSINLTGSIALFIVSVWEDEKAKSKV